MLVVYDLIDLWKKRAKLTERASNQKAAITGGESLTPVSQIGDDTPGLRRERDIENLLEIAIKNGVAAINIIPDRNYKPGVKDEKLENLYRTVELAQELHLPVIVGTEMNSPGQKFVDSFNTKELSLLVPVFLKGAHIIYAHSVLQRYCGLGYTSIWAEQNFNNVEKKNNFFEKLGLLLEPEYEERCCDFNNDTLPQQILTEFE